MNNNTNRRKILKSFGAASMTGFIGIGSARQNDTEYHSNLDETHADKFDNDLEFVNHTNEELLFNIELSRGDGGKGKVVYSRDITVESGVDTNNPSVGRKQIELPVIGGKYTIRGQCSDGRSDEIEIFISPKGLRQYERLYVRATPHRFKIGNYII